MSEPQEAARVRAALPTCTHGCDNACPHAALAALSGRVTRAEAKADEWEAEYNREAETHLRCHAEKDEARCPTCGAKDRGDLYVRVGRCPDPWHSQATPDYDAISRAQTEELNEAPPDTDREEVLHG